MFELWHITAIVGIFVLGYFFGRWTVKRYYESKYEDLQNYYRRDTEKGKGEWIARNQF